MLQDSEGSSEGASHEPLLSKGQPATVLERCCSVSVPLLVLLALLTVVLALLFIYVSDLAHLFQDKTTTAAPEDDGSGSYESCALRWGFEVLKEAKPGTETYKGPLPGDIDPLHYTITMTLCGTSLDDSALKVTGRVEVLLNAKFAASKIVLKAHPQWIKGIKVALSDTSGPACAKPKGRRIDSVTLSAPFLIVVLKDQLSAGTAYTLAVDYAYDTTVPGGPIALSPWNGTMTSQPEQAHAAFPCFEEKGWLAPVQLTLVLPPGLRATSNAPQDGQPLPKGPAFAHRFTTTPPIPMDNLTWAVFHSEDTPEN